MKFLLLLLFLLLHKILTAATCQPITTPANWSNPAQWTCGRIPTNGDVVIIPAGFTLNVTGNISQVSDVIIFQIYGILNFPTTGDKILINVASIINIYVGGSIVATSNSNQIRIGAGSPEWSGPGILSGPVIISNGTLPVELVYFKASILTINNVLLTWETATETNNNFFSIEHSTDAVNFEVIEQIKGANNSNRSLSYEYSHNAPTLGTNYYRLKQTDYDGKYSYSNICFVKIDAIIKLSVKVYPNPALNKVFTISITSAELSNTLVTLLDYSGNELYTKTNLQSVNGIIESNELKTELPSGVYIIRVSNTDAVVNQKLVIN